jgi:putative ABC transport system permease protein
MAGPRFIILQLFIRSSRVQKKRAFLTIASIAWGTLALLLLLAFGEGLGRSLGKAWAGMGTDIAVIWPGETTVPWEGLPAGRAIRPRIDDIRTIKERVPGLLGVSGEIIRWGTNFTYGNNTVNGPLKGVSTVWGLLRNQIPMSGGRFLNPLDDAQRRRAVFLGTDLAQDLFGDEDPIGKSILIDAVIPIRTLYAQYGSDRLSVLVLKPESRKGMKAALAGVAQVLSAKYGFDPEDERVLGTWDTVESGRIRDNFMLGIKLFLSIIGVLTLTVGGIGVANIMYAVVKERTREIGVKMALGARSHWVTGPIVLEGLTYTLLGGLAGLVVATVLVYLLSLVPTGDNMALKALGKPTLSPTIAATAAGVLGIIGLLAGYFPARRAASVDPAETLRYE